MNCKIEDSTTDKIPHVLYKIVDRILSESKSNDSLQKDFLYVLIIVVMAENGFLPLNNSSKVIETIESIGIEELKSWKSSLGVIETQFILMGFESTRLKLILSPLGATALVNLVIVDFDSETYTVCLPVSRYIVSPLASTIPMIFRDLKHLSTTLKNKVLSPVKSRILSECGYPSPSLIGLPDDVLQTVILKLSAKDVVNISQTCKRLYYVLEEQTLWRKLFVRDFHQETSDRTDWKTLYRDKYIEERERRLRERRLRYRSTRAGTMHDFMDYSDYISHIENPMWNII